MEKKLYYVFDNGDTPVICTMEEMNELLKADAEDYTEEKYKEDGEPEWAIRITWLTDEEFEDLPEA